MASDPENYQSTLDDVSAQLNDNDPQGAFRALRWLIRYPGHNLLDRHWQVTFELFANICQLLVGEEAATKVRAVAEHADDINALYELGYELIEFDLPDLAATVLARANALAPGHPELLSELVCALERDGRHTEACRFLSAVPDLLADNFICRYLLAFNSIMAGDLITARQIFPSLQTNEDEDEVFMTDRIAGILQRADILAGHSSLDLQDLRGWHYVLTNGMLMHISPYGLAEGMNGRYAYIRGSYELIREGIDRAIAILNCWQIDIPQVFILPDRHSEILARAIGKILDRLVINWSEVNIDSPGLIVAYDLSELDGELLELLAERRPGQILWSHASCWTQTQPIAADLTTYLYQYNVSPWVSETNELQSESSPVLSNDEIIESIVVATIDSEYFSDLEVVLKLAERVKDLAINSQPYRLKQFAGSPVSSSRFL